MGFITISLYLRVSSLEHDQLKQFQITQTLDAKLAFLQTMLQKLSANITGVEGSLEQQWQYWQSNIDVMKKVDLWKKKIHEIEQEIAASQHFLDRTSVESFLHQNLVTQQQTQDEVSLASYFSLFVGICVAALLVYYFQDSLKRFWDTTISPKIKQQ